ncbi:MAG: hypothetical protein IPJ06_04425 [Saprospiraceae bacterium]|nr:hypothetical protein [Saprospiraceae bacterium]
MTDKDVSSRYIDGVEKRLFKELLTPLGYKRDDSGFALRINSNWISIGSTFVTFDYGCKQIKSTFYAGIPWIKFLYSQIKYRDKLLIHYFDIDPHNLFPVSTYDYSVLGKYDSDFFMVCTEEEAEQVVAEVFRLFITDWHDRFVHIDTLEEFYKEVSRPYYFERYDLRSRGSRTYTWVLNLILARLVGEEEYVQCKGRLSEERKNFPYYEKDILEMDQALEFLNTHTPSQLETLGHQLEEQYNEWKSREKKRKADEQKLARLEKKKKRTEVDGAVKPIDRVVGFDPREIREVRINEEGELEIVFEFMPPLNEDGEENDDPIFEQFDEVLSKALGVEVLWDDREFFRIVHPQPDTKGKAIDFLNRFWKIRHTLG